MVDPFKEPLPASLLAKVGSILVHADELLSADGHEFDSAAMRALIADADVKASIASLGPLVPVKRKPAHD